MKKNVYLIILTVVTVVCVIVGSCYHLIGWGVSFFSHLPFMSSEEKTSAGKLINSDGVSLDEFQSINVDADVMDLDIVEGNSYSISISANKKLIPEYEVSDGLLTITQSNNLHAFWGSTKCEVTVTVPEKLDRIDIISDVGDIDLTGIEADQLTLSADVGDIDLEDCTFQTSNIKANVGDTDLDNVSFKNMEITSDVGNVELSTGNLSGYEIVLDTDIGDVKYNDRKLHGGFTVDGSGSGSLSITNDTGDITVNEHK